jgi:hypothetical protein
MLVRFNLDVSFLRCRFLWSGVLVVDVIVSSVVVLVTLLFLGVFGVLFLFDFLWIFFGWLFGFFI